MGSNNLTPEQINAIINREAIHNFECVFHTKLKDKLQRTTTDMTYCDVCDTWYEESEIKHMMFHVDEWHNSIDKKTLLPT